MLTGVLRDQLLIDELQLGQNLNQAIHEGRRSDFGLLLAMLSPDVQDQPWVADRLPEAPASKDWRQHFSLPPVRPLECDAHSLERMAAYHQAAEQGEQAACRLLDCLNPEALIREQYQLDPQVLDDMPLLAREKYLLAREGQHPRHSALDTLPPAAMLDAIAGADALPELRVHYYSSAA